jgi:hypothetical protein
MRGTGSIVESACADHGHVASGGVADGRTRVRTVRAGRPHRSPLPLPDPTRSARGGVPLCVPPESASRTSLSMQLKENLP